MAQNKKTPAAPSKTKKVSAFPIPAQMTAGAAAFVGQVVKISTHGFMMETTLGSLQTGMKLEFSFTLPVLHKIIASSGVIIKIYNNYANAITHVEGGARINLIEIHYKNLGVEQREYILEFLRKLQSPKAS